MIKGIQFSGIASGIKASGLDLGLVYFEEPTHVSALYTRNRVKAAHILYDKKLDGKPVRAILVNSGCANACTGAEGILDLGQLGGALSRLLGVRRRDVLFASTGVIGKRLPLDVITNALPDAVKNLDTGNVEAFARAIMTTDTHQKLVTEHFQGKKGYTITGVAKGSGMINPLFATMLSFIFTDYPIAPDMIKTIFREAGEASFEKITVDGECSTNDTVMLFTRGGTEDPEGFEGFKEKLNSVMKQLAMMVVHDGEGATKVAHIVVEGARDRKAAEKIARRIAVSPLTKTAFFGCDPNWGRIICAAGDASVPINQSKVDISLQGRLIVKGGLEISFSEAELKELMNAKEIEVLVNLHSGESSFDIYTTDFSYDYVKINASYRT